MSAHKDGRLTTAQAKNQANADAIATQRPLRPGDHVWIGNGRVHWVVASLTEWPETGAWLTSGMSDRRRWQPLDRLRLHTAAAAPTEPEPEPSPDRGA